jgi:hypothetical protein
VFRSPEIRCAAASVCASSAAVAWKPLTHGIDATGGADELSHEASTSTVSHAYFMMSK